MPKIFLTASFVIGLTLRVPRLPVLGENLMGHSFNLGPGGKGTNQAIAAARLGAQVSLVACIGDDLFADIALDLFRREGLSLEHVHQICGVNTGVGFVTLLPTGENVIVLDPGANMRMTPAHIDAAEDLIARADVVMTQLETPLETTGQALELGRKHGVRTILNPAPGRPVDRSLLEHVDLLTPNETEARILLGVAPNDPTPTRDLAAGLLRLGVGSVVVTQGKRGALIVTTGGVTEVPAPTVEAVDVTGAGDSFNAALAVGLAEGMTLEDSVAQAVCAGAYTTCHLGVIDGLPTREELAGFRRIVSPRC